MGRQKIVLRVKDPGGCPLYLAGERLVFSGPEVVKSESGPLCAHAVCSLYPKVRALEENRDPALPLVCEAEGCGAVFEVDRDHATEPRDRRTEVTRRLDRQRAVPAPSETEGPFMARLPPEVVHRLVALASLSEYRDGEIILWEGVVGERLFIIAAGEVEVVKQSQDAEVVLVVLGKGDCFGEMSLLTGKKTSATVRARGGCRILTLEKNLFEELLSHIPALNRVFSRLLAERLQHTSVTLKAELDRAFQGRLSMLSLVDLVQTLQANRRSGTLVLSYAGYEGRVGLEGGRIVSCLLEGLQGNEAFFELLKWPDGDFYLEENVLRHGPVTLETMALMMEGLRRLDEARREQ